MSFPAVYAARVLSKKRKAGESGGCRGMVQEARTGALRRGLSAFLQKGLAKNRKSAAAGNLPGAQDLRHTGCVRVKMRHPTPERAGRRVPQDHAGSEGRSAAARAVGLFAKRPGEKLQKRCGGEGMPMQRKSVAGTTNKRFPCCARSTSGHTFSTRRRKHKEVATDTRTGNAVTTVGNG